MRKWNWLWCGGLAATTVFVGIALRAAEAAPAEAAPSNGSDTSAAGHNSAAPTGAPTSAAKKHGGLVRISHASGQVVLDQRTGISRISDDVHVTQDGEDFTLYCDSITYNQNNSQADATGHVRIETRDSTITSELIHANFDTNIITLLHSVDLKTHGAKAGAPPSDKNAPEKKAADKPAKPKSLRDEARDKSSEMTCDNVDYNYRNHEAVATGNIHITQGANHGTCDKITYGEDRNVAILEGNVVFTDTGAGQTFRTPLLKVYIDDDMIQSPGNAKIELDPNHHKGTGPAGDTEPAPQTDFGPAPPRLEDPGKLLETPPPPVAPGTAPVVPPVADAGDKKG